MEREGGALQSTQFIASTSGNDTKVQNVLILNSIESKEFCSIMETSPNFTEYVQQSKNFKEFLHNDVSVIEEKAEAHEITTNGVDENGGYRSKS